MARLPLGWRCKAGSLRQTANTAAIELYIANKPFRGQIASELGWNSRFRGRTTIIGNVGINKSDSVQ
jgi:hypothetical protein